MALPPRPMAAVDLRPKPRREGTTPPPSENPIATYLGLSFAVFLGLLPKATISYLCGLQSRNRSLALELLRAEDQIRQLRSHRREDSKANARVVEIFASHRNAWQLEERRLLARVSAAEGEAAALRARVEELEASDNELRERLEARVEVEKGEEGGAGSEAEKELAEMYARMEMEMYASSSRANGWPNQHHQSLESLYPPNSLMPRRESPWKGGCEATGIPVRLKQLDQELDDLEKLGKIELSTILRKHAKRYQSLSAKIDDLCKKMQAGDLPNELSLSPDFRTQTQTEFLLEACRLQHQATETRQRLTALQTEMASSSIYDELAATAKPDARKLMDSVRINFKEIQRNVEVWLARIVGDIEGILARQEGSRFRQLSQRGWGRAPFGFW